MYRYYSTERPISLGTYPKAKDNVPTKIKNFDEFNSKADAVKYIENAERLSLKVREE